MALAATAAALAGPRDPRLHKRPADVQLARSLILKQADLPAGFVDKGRQKQDASSTPDLPCTQPNLHALVMTATSAVTTSSASTRAPTPRRRPTSLSSCNPLKRRPQSG